MKRLLCTIGVLFVWGMMSCNINIPIDNHLTDPNVLITGRNASELLTPVYESVPLPLFSISLLGNDFIPTAYSGREPGDLFLYNWNVSGARVVLESYWKDYYACIAQANVVLSQLDSFTPQPEDLDECLHAEAEALLIKAHAYLKLLQLYATPFRDQAVPMGVMLKDKVVEPDMPRADKAIVLQHISQHIDRAIELLKKSSFTVSNKRMTLSAALHLKCQVSLYEGDYEKCIDVANEFFKLVPVSTFSIDKLNQSMWITGDEAIVTWAVELKTNIFYHDLFARESDRKPCYLINPSLAIIDPNDTRMKIYQIYEKEGQYQFGKFNLVNMSDMQVKNAALYRPAEVLFAKAEALLHLSQISQCNELLKLYFGSVDFKKVDEGIEKRVQIDELLRLKHQEFIGEGINFFDLKRLEIQIPVHRTDGRVSFYIKKDDFRRTFPLPQDELKYNTTNPEQNRGWN